MVKKISDEDTKLFQDSMKDVVPIHQKPRVETKQKKPMPVVQTEITNRKPPMAPLILTELLAPLAHIQTIASGITPKQIRAIKQGKKRPEQVIDLHHHTQQDALQVLDSVVADYKDHKRFILLVHGTNAARGTAVLKSLVYQYFKDHPARLLLLSAHTSHGGLGATYLWLRKRS